MFFVAFIGLSSCQKPSTDTSKKYPDKKTAYRYRHHRAKTGKLYAKAESHVQEAFQRYLFSFIRKGRNLSKLVACFKFHT